MATADCPDSLVLFPSVPSLETAPPVPVANEAVARTAVAPRSWSRWLPFLLFGVLWVDLIRLLGTQWEAREQYAYGWFVPFFAAALFFRRWQDRPAQATGVCSFSLHPLGLGFLFRSGCFVGLALLLPLRVIYEVNIDWPLVAWVYTGTIVFVSLYAIFLAGGWKWVRHFAFPIAFILVAVVWPYRIEKGLTQGLMQVVATLTVEILGWLNIPALQHGNLIELSTGTVGVDEACSGIRSFQSSLMAGLLMGELYRMRSHWRIVLVVSGLIVGFCLNIVRTLLLSWQASKEGLGAIDKWHDPAGMTITVLCFFCLWALAVLLRKWTSSTDNPSDLRSQVSSHSPQTQISGVIPQLSTLNSQSFLTICGLWALVSIAATETWYRAHEVNQPRPVSWTVELPQDAPTFQPIPLTPKVSDMLKADASVTGRWQEPDGAEWTVYYFRWSPSSMQSVIRARLHRPEICLTGSGLRQLSMSALDHFDAGALRIPFHKYVFEAGGQQIYVFFGLWQDGQEQSGMKTLNQADRLGWVLAGRRGMGQQTFEIICTGYPDMDAAEAAVRQRLSALVRSQRQH